MRNPVHPPVGDRLFPAGALDAPLLLALFAIATGMSALTTLEGAMLRLQDGAELRLTTLTMGRLADWYSCALMVVPLCWLGNRFPLAGPAWRRNAALLVAAAGGAAVLKFALYAPLRRSFDPTYGHTIAEAVAGGFVDKLLFFLAAAGLFQALLLHRQLQLERRRVAGSCGHGEPAGGLGVLPVPQSGSVRFIPLDEIAWIEAQGNYVLVHSAGDRMLMRQTMRGMIALLDRRFVRVHRSAIVRLDAVERIDPAAGGRLRLTLRGGAVLTSGRAYSTGLRAWARERCSSPGK